ncbi:MAG: FkbM family methyltransferase [Phycisphaerales bacterium]|nr:MAG: FkbM family methyltransferase [Phycisphaerales bacterium]
MSTCPTIQPTFRAQFGEDRVLWQVFNRSPSGFFVEVGAYDGVALSNTVFLEQQGWRGILVEPIRPLCERAAAARPGSRVYNAACSRPGSPPVQTFTITQGVPVLSYLHAEADHVERCKREGATLVEVEVPVVTLDEILAQERKRPPGTPSAWQPGRGWRIDLVSIDVEGGELDVLAGFNLDRFKPRVLVLENDRDSGRAIEPYLAARGYRKFHRQVINDFYARDDASTADLTLRGLKAD